MNRPSRPRIVTAALLVIATGCAGLAAGSQAAANKKLFTVGLAITDPSNGNAAASASSLAPSHAYTFVFTINNVSKSPQTFGSAKIMVPTGYTASPTAATSVTGFTAASITGGILLTSTTGSGIPVGKAVAVTASVTTPATSCAAEWTTYVKQSNDFLGTGNDFLISGAQPTTTVGTNHLHWSTEPVATQYNQAMSPAPVVTALDPCGNPITTPVTVDLANDSTSGAIFDPSATTSVLTSSTNGQATFSNLMFSNFGYYDRLTATTATPGFTGETSDWFIVAQQVALCATSATCGLNLGDKQTTQATVTTGTGSAGQSVSGSKLDGTHDANNFADCTAQEGGSVQVSDTMIVDTPRAKEVTLTIAKALVNAVSNNGTPFMDICLDIPAQAQTPDNQFLTKADVAAHITVPHSWQGLLPNCVDAANTPPCVVSRNKRAANEVIVFDLPAGDPHFGAY